MVALVAVLTSAVARSFCTSFQTAAAAAVVDHAVICGASAIDTLDRQSASGEPETPTGITHHCDMCPVAAASILVAPVRVAGDVSFPEWIAPRKVAHDALPAHGHLPGIAIIRGPPPSA